MTDDLRKCLFKYGAKQTNSHGLYHYYIRKLYLLKFQSIYDEEADDIILITEVRENYCISERTNYFILTDDCNDIINDGISFRKL